MKPIFIIPFLITLAVSCFIFKSNSAMAAQNSGARLRVLTLFAKSERPPVTPQRASTSYGIELAIKQSSKMANRVDLMEFETSREISSLVVEAKEAVDKFQPDVIVGGSTSNQAFVISEIAEKEKIPFITPWATHPRLTVGKQYTYRTCFDDNYQAEKLAEFIVQSKKLKRGLVLANSRETFSVGFKDVFMRKAKQIGAVEISSIDFTDEKEVTENSLEALKERGLDFVVIPSYEIEAAALLSRIAGILPKNIEYFGPDSWGSGRIIQSVMNSMGSSWQSYVVNHWSPFHQSNENKKFLELLKSQDYYKNIESNPNVSLTSIALAFDAMNFVLKAFEESRKDGVALNQAIAKTQMRAVTGMISPGEVEKQILNLYIYRILPLETQFVRAYP